MPQPAIPPIPAEALAEVARLVETALAPGVVRVHVDPSADGLRVRARRSDRRLDELAPVPLGLAWAVSHVLRAGDPLPEGFVPYEDGPRTMQQVRLRRARGPCRRPVRVRGTPCIQGDAFCLQAPEEEDPGAPVATHDELWEARVGAALDRSMAASGGLYLALGPEVGAVRRGIRQLALRRAAEYPLLVQLGEGEAPDIPGATRYLPRYGPETSRYEVGWTMKDGPDRVVLDPPYGDETLDVAARAALGGTQVLAGLAVPGVGLALARWVHPQRLGELLQHALRGLLHCLDLPRLCRACRRPRGDLAPAEARALAPLLRRGTRYERVGCEACAGHGLDGTVGLRAWTPVSASLIADLRHHAGFEARARAADEATRAAGAELRDQLALALREGWIDPPAARRGLDCLAGMPE